MNVRDMAREYVKTVNGPTNGWGQNVHPIYGVSHNMLAKMFRDYGRGETDAAIDAAFAEARKQGE